MKYLGLQGRVTTDTVGELSIIIVTSKNLPFLRVFFIFFNIGSFMSSILFCVSIFPVNTSLEPRSFQIIKGVNLILPTGITVTVSIIK